MISDLAYFFRACILCVLSYNTLNELSTSLSNLTTYCESLSVAGGENLKFHNVFFFLWLF